MSFKVIDINISGKLVTSDCYDKQQGVKVASIVDQHGFLATWLSN